MRLILMGAIVVFMFIFDALYPHYGMPTAAPAEPPRVASNVEECTPIGTAGNQTIYRCDDWQVSKLVYTNNFGFLFVVEGE